jgi:hypothetical protein
MLISAAHTLKPERERLAFFFRWKDNMQFVKCSFEERSVTNNIASFIIGIKF